MATPRSHNLRPAPLPTIAPRSLTGQTPQVGPRAPPRGSLNPDAPPRQSPCGWAARFAARPFGRSRPQPTQPPRPARLFHPPPTRTFGPRRIRRAEPGSRREMPRFNAPRSSPSTSIRPPARRPTPCGLLLPPCRSPVCSVARILVDEGANIPGAGSRAALRKPDSVVRDRMGSRELRPVALPPHRTRADRSILRVRTSCRSLPSPFPGVGQTLSSRRRRRETTPSQNTPVSRRKRCCRSRRNSWQPQTFRRSH